MCVFFLQTIASREIEQSSDRLSNKIKSKMDKFGYEIHKRQNAKARAAW